MSNPITTLQQDDRTDSPLLPPETLPAPVGPIDATVGSAPPSAPSPDLYTPPPTQAPQIDPLLPSITGTPTQAAPLAPTPGLTPAQQLDKTLAPQIQAGQAQVAAEAQFASDGADRATTFPTYYSPPDLEGVIKTFDANATAMQLQQKADEEKAVGGNGINQVTSDWFNRVSGNINNPNIPERGPAAPAFNWIGQILGQSEEGGRTYIRPFALNEKGEYAASPLGPIMYGLGILQNSAMGAALDAGALIQRGNQAVGNAYNAFAPAWAKPENSPQFLKDTVGKVLGPLSSALTDTSNTAIDGKSNFIEALRGAQYSFSDDLGKGFGIKNNMGFKVGGVDVNPSVLVGVGLDVVLGAKVDKLFTSGVAAVTKGTKVATTVPDLITAAPVAATKKVIETPGLFNPVQLELPFLSNPQLTVPKISTPNTPKLKKPKVTPGTPAPKVQQQVLPIKGMMDEYYAADRFINPAAYADYGTDVGGQLQLPLNVPSKKVKTPKVPSTKPTPTTPPEGIQQVLPLDETLVEFTAAERASNPLAYAEYTTRKKSGQLELPLGVPSTPVERVALPPVAKTPKSGGKQLVLQFDDLPEAGLPSITVKAPTPTGKITVRQAVRKAETILAEAPPPKAPVRSVEEAIQSVPRLQSLDPVEQAVLDVVQVTEKAKIIGVARANVAENYKAALAEVDLTDDIARQFSTSPIDVPSTFTLTGKKPIATRANATVYHGTKVENLDIRAIDPTRGGSASELGLGVYTTIDKVVAERASLAALNPDLPPIEGRIFSSQGGTVHELQLNSKSIIDATKPNSHVVEIANRVAADFPEIVEPFTPRMTLTDVFDHASQFESHPGARREFQRHLTNALKAEGYTGAKAGNTYAIYDTSVLTQRGVTPTVGGAKAADALRERALVDNAAPPSAISLSNAAESRVKALGQAQHDLDLMRTDIEGEVADAVTKSGLMDHPVIDDYAPPTSLMDAITQSGDAQALKLIREGDINGALNRLDDLGIDTFDITFESKASIPRNPNPCGY